MTVKADELRKAADELPDMEIVMGGLSAMLTSYPGVLREHADALDRIARMEAALGHIESMSPHSGGEIHGMTRELWRDAFTGVQSVARAALAPAAPTGEDA